MQIKTYSRTRFEKWQNLIPFEARKFVNINLRSFKDFIRITFEVEDGEVGVCAASHGHGVVGASVVP